MKAFRLFGTALAMALTLGTAQAVTLSPDSTITFAGSINPATNVATTTALDFQPFVVATSVTGDLESTVNRGDTVTFTDFIFAPFTGGSNPLWQVGGFSFDLVAVVLNSQNAVSLVLLGSGLLSGNGFDPTPFDFSLSADRTRVIGFSATNAATPIPEPGSLLLLGTGLVMLVGRKMRMA